MISILLFYFFDLLVTAKFNQVSLCRGLMLVFWFSPYLPYSQLTIHQNSSLRFGLWYSSQICNADLWILTSFEHHQAKPEAHTESLNYSHWCPCWIWMTSFSFPCIQKHTLYGAGLSCSPLLQRILPYGTQRSLTPKEICISNVPQLTLEGRHPILCSAYSCLFASW